MTGLAPCLIVETWCVCVCARGFNFGERWKKMGAAFVSFVAIHKLTRVLHAISFISSFFFLFVIVLYDSVSEFGSKNAVVRPEEKRLCIVPLRSKITF